MRRLRFEYDMPGRGQGGSGFTLLEFLAVLVVLGVVAAFLAVHFDNRYNQREWTQGKAGVSKLSNDIARYTHDNGSPPGSLRALRVKPPGAPSWNGPYAKPADLTDPFGHHYGYVYPGKHGRYDIVFYGRDGKPGGKGIDRDYGNWQ